MRASRQLSAVTAWSKTTSLLLWRRLKSFSAAVRGRPFQGRGEQPWQSRRASPEQQCWVLSQPGIPAEVLVPRDPPPYTPAGWHTNELFPASLHKTVVKRTMVGEAVLALASEELGSFF